MCTNFIELQKAFGGKVKQIRKRQGITQELLAEEAKITSRYLIDVEHGRYGPSFETIYNLAQALKVEPKDLFDFSDLVDTPDLRSIGKEVPLDGKARNIARDEDTAVTAAISLDTARVSDKI